MRLSCRVQALSLAWLRYERRCNHYLVWSPVLLRLFVFIGVVAVFFAVGFFGAQVGLGSYVFPLSLVFALPSLLARAVQWCILRGWLRYRYS